MWPPGFLLGRTMATPVAIPSRGSTELSGVVYEPLDDRNDCVKGGRIAGFEQIISLGQKFAGSSYEEVANDLGRDVIDWTRVIAKPHGE